MSLWTRKSVSRREQIRKDRPDKPARRRGGYGAGGVVASLQVAAKFWVLATAILMLRDDVVPYRPGQWAHHDILARVDFNYMDSEKLPAEQRRARENEPQVYALAPDAWKQVEDKLIALPDRVAAASNLSD